MIKSIKNKWNDMDAKNKVKVSIHVIFVSCALTTYIVGKSSVKTHNDGFAKFADGTIIHDKTVADIVKKQLNYFEKRDVQKVVETAFAVFADLSPNNMKK